MVPRKGRIESIEVSRPCEILIFLENHINFEKVADFSYVTT